MSVDAGTIYSSVRVKLDALEKDVKSVQSQFDKINKSTGTASANANTASTSFMKLAGSFTAGSLAANAISKAMSAVVDFTKESIQVSIDAQETFSKYDVVFEGMGDSAEDTAQRFAKAFDLAGVTAKDMLANTGNLLQGFGATREESLKMSEQVNTLASDLASFTNYSGGAKGASEALTKALLGERESAKGLGIAILESDVQVELARKGQQGLTGEALKLAKAQATLEIITKQAKNSIGDYARTSDSASNTLKRAKESSLELKVALGTALNPATTLAADLWERVARALADSINHQNELKGAKKNIKDQVETTKDLILVTEEKIKKERENYEYTRTQSPVAARKVLEEISALKEELKIYQARLAFEKSLESQRKVGAEGTTLAQKERLEQLEKERIATDVLNEQINGRKQAEKEYNDAVNKTSFDLSKGLITTEQANTNNLKSAQQYIDALYALGYASESEIGTVGYNALQSMIDKYKELVDVTRLATEETIIYGAESKPDDLLISGMTAYREEIDKTMKKTSDWYNLSQDVIKELLSSFSYLGEELANNDAEWSDWGKVGLGVLASLLQGMGDLLAARAAESAITALLKTFAPELAIPIALAGAAAAYTAAGWANAYAGSFETGGIVPGSSYSGDKMIARVNSGERIYTAEQNAKIDRIFDSLESGGVGETVIPLTIKLDGKVLAKNTTRYQKAGKV